MNNPIIGQLFSLGFILLFALLVWRYYKQRTYPLSQKYSTFGPRFWTGSVDSCVLWPIGFAVVALSTLKLPTVVVVIIVLVQDFAWLIYTVHMHAKYGQTYGKMVCKVKVVDFKTEGALTFRQALLREGLPTVASLGFVGYEIYLLVSDKMSQEAITTGQYANGRAFWFISILPGLWFLAEVLTMLTNEKRRALHDYIAGTVVIRTNIEQAVPET